MKQLILAGVVLFFTSLSLYAQPLTCLVRAKSAILFNLDTEAILFQKQAREPCYPASIMKIATALYVLEDQKLDLDTEYQVSAKAVETMNAQVRQASLLSYPPHILEHDGVVMGLKEKEVYTLNTLLHGLLLISANDAANVIAENYSGTIEKFIKELNEFLEKKGILQTHFQNPHGLYHPAQLTTAYDMAKITALALKNSVFSKIIQAKKYESPDLKQNVLLNRNSLLTKGRHHYEKALGGKTGYTYKSGFNLVAIAEDKGRRLIAVLLGYKSKDDPMQDAIALFEAAFREKEKNRILFSKDHECFTQKIPKANQLIKGHFQEDVLLSYFPSEEQPFKAKLNWNSPLSLPIAKGERIGEVIIENEQGKELLRAPFFSEKHVQKKLFYRILTPGKGIWLILIFAIFSLILLQYLKKRSKFIQ